INLNTPAQSNILLNLSILTTLPEEMTESSLISSFMALNGILSFLYFVQIQQVNEHDDTFLPSNVLKIKKYIDTHYEEVFSLALLEEIFHMSKYQICHLFSKYLGTSPLQYLNHLRLEQAKKLLLISEHSIHEISSTVGFDNYNHFIRLFKREYGLTPAVFRQLALEN
ncbi:MAG: helix-turn-helix domain-containing protein, partial [Coprococcus sp.]